MTIETLDNRINQDADGVQTTFPFNFKTFEADSIIIYYDAVVQETGFTVTLNTDQDLAPGGVVDFDVAPVLDVVVTIQRLVDNDQRIAYQPYDPFPAATHEGALDKLTMLTQQLAEELDRAYKAPINTEPGLDFVMPPYDAGKLLGWSETDEGVIDNSEYSFQDIADEANKAIASAAAALISEDLARDYANEDEDIEVEGSLFSAKHYAIKAAKSVGGIRIRGIISADNLCDKPGDDAGDCNEPDERNPSERFTDFVFQGGDAFIISSAGDMNLNDVDDPGVEVVQALNVGDYVIYLPEVQVDGEVVIAEGWHPQEGLSSGGTSANLVSFDDAGTTAKGTDVQIFNAALDAIVESNRLAGVQNAANIATNVTAIGDNATDISNNTTLANTKKNETDFVRTGTRLDINNVGTA